MNRWLFCIIFSCLGANVSSAPASVRSGDHPDFARIVVTVPAGANWEVGRVPEGFAVRVEGVAEYQTNNIFTRISTSRITDVESQAGPDQLVLFSDCLCHATAFAWKSNQLVIDINDGSAPIGSTFDASLQPEQETLALPVLTSRSPTSELSKSNMSPDFDFSAASKNHVQLDALEKIVVESLARAATQGLLSPTENLKSVTSDLSHFDAHIARNKPGLLTHTSIDLGINSPTTIDESSGLCLPVEYFAVADWVNSQQFLDRVTQARARIASEFDRVDPVAVIELARTYLIFGFGREAQNALSIDGEKSREREALFLMGAIIDGDPITPSMLDTQLSCDGPEALWAFLAGPVDSKAKGDRNNILREFKSLPLNLQSHLAPILSNRFRKIGDFDAAEMLLSSGSDEYDQTTETTVAQTDLLTDLGKRDEAVEVLAGLAASDSRMTPMALVNYLTLATDSESGVDLEAIALGDILRYENKGSEVVGDLAAAQVVALISIENFSAAFKLLDDEADAIGAMRKADLTTAAVLAATEKYDEPEFLDLAFSMDLEEVTAETQNAVARRLLALGLPERAARLLGDTAIGTEMMERRYLRAQAAVDVGNDQSALRELAGLSTERAEKMRNQAELATSGREAISLVAFGDDWKLGNWAALSQSNDVLLQNVSRSVLSDVEVLAGAGEPLAEGRRLLTQSYDTRNLLGEMLTRFEVVSD